MMTSGIVGQAVRSWLSLLLLIYPASFRHRLGGDLRRTLLDRFEEEYRRGGAWGLARYTFKATVQAARDGLAERYREWRSNTISNGPSQFGNAGRAALRSLRRRPAFYLIAVATLALGISATTTVFSVVDAVLLRPLPYPEPDRLVVVGVELPERPGLGNLSWPLVRDFIDRANTVSSIATVRGHWADVSPDEYFPSAERLWAAGVSAEFFAVFGQRPIIGRTFIPEEDHSATLRSVVLTHSAWQRRWQGDSSLVGRSVIINDEPHTVLGVLGADFIPPEGLRLGDVEAFVPALVPMEGRRYGGYDRGYFQVVARLAPQQSEASAQAELAGILQGVREQEDRVQQGRLAVASLQSHTVAAADDTLMPLFGAVWLLLLMAGVNVMSLFLTRSTERSRELAVKAALGASRGSLIAQLGLEGIIIGLAGSLAGLTLTAGGIAALSSWSPGDIPRLAEVSLTGRVTLFALALGIVAGAVVGIMSAVRSRASETAALRDAAAHATASRSTGRLRSILVVSQTAMAFMLLIGAGLLANSFVRLARVDPGFQAEGVVVAQLFLGQKFADDPATGQEYRRRVLSSVRMLPQVTSAGTTMLLPLDGFGGKGDMQFTIESAPQRDASASGLNWVSPGYFRTMEISLLAGRDFGDSESDGNAVIVSESFERAYWHEGSIVGQRIKMGPADSPAGYRTVIGVVSDVKGADLASQLGPTVYFLDQAGVVGPPLFITARGSDPDLLAQPVRQAIAGVDPTVPVGRLEPMTSHVARSVTAPRFYSLLLAGFASVALTLAVIGIYGSLSFTVGQRTRELGLRMALGARESSVVALVFRQCLYLALAGIILGLAGALSLSRWLEGFLFQITSLDLATYLTVIAVLLLSGVAATVAPARRAARIDPVTALKAE